MKHLFTTAAAVLALSAGSAFAQQCGANTGEAATGEPIKVGGIYGDAAPGDFGTASRTADAYFDCVNANGGIHGRPIEYLTENDQWNPELAAQAAAKLIDDEGVVAIVGNGSFVEMAVNAQKYQDSGIMAMASACAVSECFESPSIVSTNQGPLPSTVGAAQYMVEEQGATNISCIGLAIPNVGPWSCGAMEAYMESKGLAGSSVLLNPAAPDVNSGLLEAIASGADSILVNLPGGLAIAFLKAAEEQDLRDAFTWSSSTPMYDLSIPAALGDYWNNGSIFVNAELAPFDDGGPDNQNWSAVMDAFDDQSTTRDTFSQSGFLTANIFVDTLLKMDPADVDDRAKVREAIVAIKGYESDLMCGPYYVGESDFHMPNHAGHMVVIKDGGFEVVRDCYEYDSPYFEKHIALEKEMGLR